LLKKKKNWFRNLNNPHVKEDVSKVEIRAYVIIPAFARMPFRTAETRIVE
jgi:hypothetical protein